MDQPRSDSSITPTPPTVAYRPPRLGGGAETVINPERRGTAMPSADGVSLPTSSAWHRLFPSDADLQEPIQVPTAIGLELGHFVIEERIGAGGMGAVFRATDTRLQRAIALKILAPSLSRDAAAVQRFRNEACAAARLDHENIARVFFIGEDQGLHFIAFEFITGVNLRNLIRERGRIEPDVAVNYVLQIASALRHTSANGVVHRDIKPSNIIITPSGRVKLVDLGLARKESSESAQELTLAGTTLGTFDYISPEQAKDPRNVDVRSDIYSLGCTMYHMLTGEPPYPEGTVLKKLLDHQSGEPPDPAKKNRRVSDELSMIVRRMMASDPKRRYQTPDQLIRDLMLVAGSLGLRGINPEGLVWLSSQRSMSDFWRQNAGVLVMGALLVLIVVGLRQYPKFGTDSSDGLPQLVASNSTSTGIQSTPNADRTKTSNDDPSRAAHPSATSQRTSSNDNADALDRTSGSRLVVADDDGPSIPPQPLFRTLPDDVLNHPDVRPLSTQLNRVELSPHRSSDKPTTPETVAARTDTSATVRSTSTISSSESSRDSAATADKTPMTTEETVGVFVLATDGSPAKRFPTLEAACAAVADGSAIELRYNGRRAEKPLRLGKKNLTIRAGKGFHPVVEFSPNTTASDAHLRLISVSSGPVQIANVGFEVTVPAFFAIDRISLFSVDRSEQLRLQGVAITLNNPGQRPTALFDLSSEPGQMLADMKMSTSGMPKDPLEIELNECFVRGNGDLFHVRNTKPGRLSLRDSAVTLDGTLLRVEGHSEKPAETTLVELRLEHVTGVFGQNLVRLDSGELPRELPPVRVKALNNVLITSNGGSLVAMSGNTNDADFRSLFQWSGEKNFYDRCQVFWSFASGAESLGFDDWKARWGTSGDVGSSNDKLIWLGERTNMAQATVESLTLDRNTDSSNPAIAAATDGNDAGVDVSRLPRLAEVEPRGE